MWEVHIDNTNAVSYTSWILIRTKRVENEYWESCASCKGRWPYPDVEEQFSTLIDSGKTKLTHLKTSETGTIYSEKLGVVLSFVLNGDFHKNEVQRIAHAFKRETQLLLPNGVKVIVLHNTRLVGESTGRGRP